MLYENYDDDDNEWFLLSSNILRLIESLFNTQLLQKKKLIIYLLQCIIHYNSIIIYIIHIGTK